MGIKTRIVSTYDIYNGSYFIVEGRDNQENIKHFIKEAKEVWSISYVLFIGDHKNIPVRYCHNKMVYEDKFISELYFADILDRDKKFSDWDPNHNGIFGEWNGERAQDPKLDPIPDICIGRLPCSSSVEVIQVCNKIIHYERYSHCEDPRFHHIILVDGNTYPDGKYEIVMVMKVRMMDNISSIF